MPITNHLRYYVPYLEKHKAVQIFPVLEDRNHEEYIIFSNFTP